MEVTIADLYLLIFACAACFAVISGFNSGYQR